MPEPKKSAARSRAKKKVSPAALLVDPSLIPETPAMPPEISSAPGSVESLLLMMLGVLFVVGALFPRSLRQLLMLGLGSGLLYRGMNGVRAPR